MSFKDLLAGSEKAIDRLRARLRKRAARRPPRIVPFHGFGTVSRLDVRGRVLEDKGLTAAKDDDTALINMVRVYKLLETDEIPGAVVEASFLGMRQRVVTDEEGYFRIGLPIPTLLSEADPWLKVALSASHGDFGEARAQGRVLVPPGDAPFGVISDIDDTIIYTGATSFLEMLRNTFLKNAKTRLPFAGVKAFYQALRRGPTGHAQNPIFYVSNSPWNLFEFLDEFIELNGLPRGPILLRDFGLDQDKFIKDDRHKHRQITHLLQTYPFPFILIGDSGEKDPEIYRQIVEAFPGRIHAVYIRDVTEEARDAEVIQIKREVEERGVDMLMVAETREAAEHAIEKGFIQAPLSDDDR